MTATATPTRLPIYSREVTWTMQALHLIGHPISPARWYALLDAFHAGLDPEAGVASTDPNPARVIAWTRDETDCCQCLTPGCAIDHTTDHGPCETW